MNAETPLKGKKRAVKSLILPRKLGTQEMHRKRLPKAVEISTKLINDTIKYLKAVSDHIPSSDTVSSWEWATMHLATQLLLSRYEDIIAKEEVSKVEEVEEVEKHAVSDSFSAQTLREDKCWRCAAADEERLYD